MHPPLINGRVITVAQASVLLYLFAVPWSFNVVPSLSGHDFSRFVEITVMCICALAWLSSPTAAPQRGVNFLALTIALAACTSATMADRPSWAFREIALWAGMLSIGAVVAKDGNLLNAARLTTTAALACALYNTLELLSAIGGMAQGLPALPTQMAWGYNNERFFNHVQTVALPLVAVLPDAQGDKRWSRPLTAFVLSTGFALDVMEGGRATLLAIGLGGLGIALLAPAASSRVLRRLITGAALGYAVHLSLFAALPAMLGLEPAQALTDRLGDTASMNHRAFLWRLALADIAEAPWLGIGPMHFAHRPNVEAAHPHNIYLQLGAEFGLPLLFAFTGIFATCIAKWGSRLRHLPAGRMSSISAGALLACLASLIDGFFSGNFVMPVSQLWISVVWGLGWRMLRTQEPATSKDATSMSVWPALAAVVLCGWLLAVTLQDLTQITAVLAKAEALGTGMRQNPRFWSSGWF